MPYYAFIWDLDGTLFDSYPVIAPSLRDTCAELGLSYPLDYVHDFVIRSSVSALIQQAAEQLGLDPAVIKTRYSRISNSRNGQIRAMPGALPLLSALREAGWPSFVYTHRGASSFEILENTGLAPFFTEVLTSQCGFPRKPDPAAICYLLERYGLDPASTYYVGDRSLDIEAAKRAGIRSILYLDPRSPGKPTGLEDHVVHDLTEILSLL